MVYVTSTVLCGPADRARYSGDFAVLHSVDMMVTVRNQPLWAGPFHLIKHEIHCWLAYVTESWHDRWNGYLE